MCVCVCVFAARCAQAEKLAIAVPKPKPSRISDNMIGATITKAHAAQMTAQIRAVSELLVRRMCAVPV